MDEEPLEEPLEEPNMSHLSIESFLTQLKTTLSKPDYTPYYDPYERIRISNKDGETFCPLTLVAYDISGKRINIDRWGTAADLLGMDKTDAYDILCAADYEDHSLRHELVKALFEE